MITRIGLYAFAAIGAYIVLLAVRQWLRKRKENRQVAEARASRYRAAYDRLTETADLEDMYAAPSYEKEDR